MIFVSEPQTKTVRQKTGKKERGKKSTGENLLHFQQV